MVLRHFFANFLPIYCKVMIFRHNEDRVSSTFQIAFILDFNEFLCSFSLKLINGSSSRFLRTHISNKMLNFIASGLHWHAESKKLLYLWKGTFLEVSFSPIVHSVKLMFSWRKLNESVVLYMEMQQWMGTGSSWLWSTQGDKIRAID